MDTALFTFPVVAFSATGMYLMHCVRKAFLKSTL